MAVGLPLKTTYANGDVYSASDVNDTNGTVNLFKPTAKGDLIAASAANTPAILSVGANDLVVTADSTQSTGLKYSGGWTTWTPTLTNFTKGNGILEARYQKIGKMINFVFSLTFGSTSTMGSNPYFSLPVSGTYTQNPFGTCKIEDYGTLGMYGGYTMDNTNCYFYIIPVNGTYMYNNGITSTYPMTWTTNDRIVIQASYEVA